MQQKINLKAGVLARVQTTGLYAALVITGAETTVDVAFKARNQVLEELRTIGRSMQVRSDQPFHAVELKSPIDTVVELVVTNGRVTVDGFQGATVNVTSPTPLLVSNDRGTPGNLLYVSGVSLSDAPAVSITNGTPQACGPVAVVIKTANANAKSLRFSNIGVDPVAIGAAGITWANRCVVLSPGDVWTEDDAANLAWSAITDAGKTASVTVQEIVK